jgi:hypothetical protein
MAKINIEYDTESKDAVVTIDGNKVEDFYYAYVYGKCNGMEGMCTVESKTKHDGYSEVKCVYASDKNIPLSNRLAELLK